MKLIKKLFLLVKFTTRITTFNVKVLVNIIGRIIDGSTWRSKGIGLTLISLIVANIACFLDTKLVIWEE